MADREIPSGPNDYASGFFAADYRGITAQAYSAWIEPGPKYLRVFAPGQALSNGDTRAQITTANTQWDNMTRFQRWRVRLHHEALIKKQHKDLSKIFVYYHTGIPKAKKEQIKLATNASEFEFLGHTFAQAKAKLEARQVGLTSKFWQGQVNIAPGEPDEVVSGWESDFGI